MRHRRIGLLRGLIPLLRVCLGIALRLTIWLRRILLLRIALLLRVGLGIALRLTIWLRRILLLGIALRLGISLGIALRLTIWLRRILLLGIALLLGVCLRVLLRRGIAIARIPSLLLRHILCRQRTETERIDLPGAQHILRHILPIAHHTVHRLVILDVIITIRTIDKTVQARQVPLLRQGDIARRLTPDCQPLSLLQIQRVYHCRPAAVYDSQC